MRFPTQKVVQCIRDSYPAGCRVELVKIGGDPFSKLKSGDRGTVRHVDDTGTVFVAWDCGSGLGMVYGVDIIKRIEA